MLHRQQQIHACFLYKLWSTLIIQHNSNFGKIMDYSPLLTWAGGAKVRRSPMGDSRDCHLDLSPPFPCGTFPGLFPGTWSAEQPLLLQVADCLSHEPATFQSDTTPWLRHSIIPLLLLLTPDLLPWQWFSHRGQREKRGKKGKRWDGWSHNGQQLHH